MSWLFMAIEGPVSIWVISRLPHPEINTAAFLIMMSLAIWIESPVIDLLSTSTTLAKNGRDWAVLRRFVTWVCLGVSTFHGLVALTPLYWTVAGGILGVPHSVAEAARLGLIIMIPWSALIGWRRTLQGVLIRFDHTRSVAKGTMVRVVAMIGSSVGLFFLSPWPSIVIVAIGLLTSVFVEAVFVHAVSRSVVRERLGQAPDPTEPAMTPGRLMAFHFPLTATTMVNLIASPIIAAWLARTPNAVITLASYEVTSAVLFLHRAVTYCLPEVVITLYRDAQTRAILRRFSLSVGMVASGVLLLMALTGLDVWFFQHVLGAKSEIAQMAHWAYLASCFVPLLDAMHAYVRGMLTAHHLTVSRLFGVLAGTVVLVGVLALGVALQWPGAAVAGSALTACIFTEVAVLAVAWRRSSDSRAAS